MVLESNRDLVLRRLVECLGRDRTRHQVAEVTSLGLVQMTRKRVGQGLLEAFSEPCEVCNGRGYVIQSEPVEKANRGTSEPAAEESVPPPTRRRGRRAGEVDAAGLPTKGRAPNALPKELAAREAVKATLATIAAAAAHAHEEAEHGHVAASEAGAVAGGDDFLRGPREGLTEALAHEEPEGGDGREADRDAPGPATADATPDGPGGTGQAADVAGLPDAGGADDGSVHAPLGSVDRDASEHV
jgi:ribonuclease E